MGENQPHGQGEGEFVIGDQHVCGVDQSHRNHADTGNIFSRSVVEKNAGRDEKRQSQGGFAEGAGGEGGDKKSTHRNHDGLTEADASSGDRSLWAEQGIVAYIENIVEGGSVGEQPDGNNRSDHQSRSDRHFLQMLQHYIFTPPCSRIENDKPQVADCPEGHHQPGETNRGDDAEQGTGHGRIVGGGVEEMVANRSRADRIPPGRLLAWGACAWFARSHRGRGSCRYDHRHAR